MKEKSKLIIFDWGNTIMRDFEFPGPMKDWPEVAWIPGMDEVLQVLWPQYRLCIATSAPHSDTEDMKAALGRVGATRFFDHAFSSFELGCSKPSESFFSNILKALDVLPSNALSVGDRYEKDVIPAKALGMKAVLFNEKKVPGDYPAADMVITTMAELPVWIEKLMG